MTPAELFQLMRIASGRRVKIYIEELHKSNDVDRHFYQRLVEMFTECRGYDQTVPGREPMFPD